MEETSRGMSVTRSFLVGMHAIVIRLLRHPVVMAAIIGLLFVLGAWTVFASA
jgi:hypothetical protein